MLRIGSANLNNRSMGMDTERDFAIEAARAPNEAEVRRGIADFRDDLLAEHLGVSAKALARTIAEKGSVARAIDALNGVSQRQLRFFDEPRPNRLAPVEHNALMDPHKPLGRDERVDSGKLGLASAAILSLTGLAMFARRGIRWSAGRQSSTGGTSHVDHQNALTTATGINPGHIRGLASCRAASERNTSASRFHRKAEERAATDSSTDGRALYRHQWIQDLYGCRRGRAEHRW